MNSVSPLVSFLSPFGLLMFFAVHLLLILSEHRFQSAGLNPVTAAMLLLTIVAAAIFLRLEAKGAQPMVNLSLFRNVTFSFANISALLNFMSQYVVVFLSPFYLQRILHFAPGHLGLIMTSAPLAVMAVAPISGALSDRIGTIAPACLGAAVCGLALFFMSRLPVSAGSGDVVWRLALFGLGTGIFQSPNNSAAMGSAPRPHLGVASGILVTVRNLGMVLGIATGGAVLHMFALPVTVQKAILSPSEAAAFFSGLKHAYLVGGVLSWIAVATTLVRSKE